MIKDFVNLNKIYRKTMQITNIDKLTPTETKLLLYFLYLISTNKVFNFNEVSDTLFSGQKEVVFSTIKSLWDREIIELNIQELQNKSDLICNINNSLIFFNISQLNKTDLQNFNVTLFIDKEDLFPYVVNGVYIPLGKYDAEYMSDYINTKEKQESIFKPDEQKEKKKQREKLRRDASKVVDIFYAEFLDKNPRIKLTPDQRKWEEKLAQEFIKDRGDDLDFDEIAAAAIWFTNDPFWSQHIVNITGFRKHYNRFLVKRQREPNSNLNIKLI